MPCRSSFPQSRQEVESLGDRKKGWKKANDGISSSRGLDSILGQEALEKTKKAGAGALAVENIKKPKNAMEFNRDWRRLKDPEKKLRFGYLPCILFFPICVRLILASLYNCRYLVKIGPSACNKLLSSHGDSDFFEEILLFLKDIAYDDSQCDREGIVEILDDTESTCSEGALPQSKKKRLNMLTLFMELSSVDNFDFMKAMMDKSILSSVSEWIRGRIVKEDAQNQEGGDTSSSNTKLLEELASKYYSIS